MIESRHFVINQKIESRHSVRFCLTKGGASLNRFVAKYGRYLTTPVVLHSRDVAQRNGILHLPLYMAGFL